VLGLVAPDRHDSSHVYDGEFAEDNTDQEYAKQEDND
jgi:hypothetical protein